MIINLASIRPWLRRLQHGKRTPPELRETPVAGLDAPAVPGTIEFTCNLCGTRNTVAPAELSHETPSCRQCASTVRLRAVVHLLCTELFRRDVALTQLPAHKHLRGIRLSDDDRYAAALAAHFDYTNTCFDAAPQLDITRLPKSMVGQYDFLIAESFSNLVFHGGPGRTLEMRLFSQAGLMQQFAAAGFGSYRIASEPCPAHGTVWPEPWSVPIVAIA